MSKTNKPSAAKPAKAKSVNRGRILKAMIRRRDQIDALVERLKSGVLSRSEADRAREELRVLLSLEREDLNAARSRGRTAPKAKR